MQTRFAPRTHGAGIGWAGARRGEESPVVKLQRLSATDGFIVFDLDAATTCVGIARLAPKVLQDGAALLARSVTYSFASFGVAGHAGDPRESTPSPRIATARSRRSSRRSGRSPTRAACAWPLGWA